MVTAFVLLNTQPSRVGKVAQALVEIPQVSEVYTVGGRFDLVAVIRVQDNDQLNEVMTEQALQVEGITHSETLIAFRAVSRHDLERMFSLGE